MSGRDERTLEERHYDDDRALREATAKLAEAAEAIANAIPASVDDELPNSYYSLTIFARESKVLRAALAAVRPLIGKENRT
jgi:hypothetical protein